MNDYFNFINWNDVFCDLNANDSFNKWLSIYQSGCELFIPTLRTDNNKRIKDPLWMNMELKRICKRKRDLWFLCRNSNFRNNMLVSEYKQLNSAVKKMVKINIREFEQNLARNARTNPKLVYRYINSKTTTKESIKAIFVNVEGDDKDAQADKQTTTDGAKIASELNKYFVSVFIKEDTVNIPKVGEKFNIECPNPSFTEGTIRLYIDKLNAHKAIGVDNVHPKVLKKCSVSLCKPLSLIFTKSYESGVVPHLWRKANIVPLFKKGNKLEPSNYRPISLTSIVCKVMERIIRDEITNHLVKNKLIIKQQHGFVNKKNCMTNLLETMDFITKALADGYNIDEILLDFAKAFDSVLLIRLCLKLDYFGIRNKLLSWCKSFLSGRWQRVIIGEFMSDWEEIDSGVPQGSVLGPLFFVMLINDLLTRIKNEGKLFADDTKLFAVIVSELDNLELQNDLNILKEWTNDWQIKFNSLKCKVMYFGNRNPKYEYKIDGVTLEEGKLEKDLGIFISNDNGWSHHISYESIKPINKWVESSTHLSS